MNISQLTSKAIIAYLTSQSLTLVSNLYRGIEGSDTSALTTEEAKRQLPCVIADCSISDFGTFESGNWWVDARVRVLTNADDNTEDEHHLICQQVFGKFMTSTIVADLSAALANFTALQVLHSGQGSTQNERHWESFISLRIYAAPSDIS